MNNTIIDNGNMVSIPQWKHKYLVKPPKHKQAMKNLIFFILIIFLASTKLTAQRITVIEKDVPFKTVIRQINQQSGYSFSINERHMKIAKDVTISAKDKELKTVLDEIFSGQPFGYSIEGKIIVSIDRGKEIQSKQPVKKEDNPIRGKVMNEKGEPLAGASLRIKGTNIDFSTDGNGIVLIPEKFGEDILQVSFVGYSSIEIPVRNVNNIFLHLNDNTIDIVDVVSTGYQNIPKERATGSFVQIDNQLLNRRVSPNILDRLDGVTSGLIFNKISGPIGLNPPNEKLGISIRGRVTIDDKVSADPLVVLDNFPYEGDINNINPNDIESITVLKDAAAASIWGSRSGNGVIVITTKKGKFNQPLKIDFNSNLTVGAKPDLKYSRNFLKSSEFIDVETFLFNKGYYDPNINDNNYYPVISPVVELLSKQKNDPSNKNITDQINRLRNVDVRDQTTEYFYRPSLNQQYSLGFRGGSEKAIYSLSIGYDKNRNTLFGSGNNRFTINSTNTYHPIKNLEITGSVLYTKSENKFGYQYTSPYPYIRFVDDDKNPLAVPYGKRDSYLEDTQNLGFLDWKYRPIQERDLYDTRTKTDNILIRGIMRYNFTDFFNAEIQYQHENEFGNNRGYRSPESYEARNFVNMYSQRSTEGSFTYPFPKGGILYLTDRKLYSNNFRTQLNFNKEFGQKHLLSAIAGAEIREIVSESTDKALYGYNHEFGTSVTNLNYNIPYPINPSALGSAVLPSPLGKIIGNTNRYISYYANGAYTYLGKYTFSLSGRKDGANIFGVKTNDKMTPLWSTGVAYDISKESFYKFPLIPYLKLRASFGYNGNVYNASSYLTATYDVSPITGLPIAYITSAPNAELRWEKIRNKNLALDFSSKGNRLNGSFEIYDKLGTDLIEDALLAHSTGFSSYKGNAATVKTKGFDINLNSVNLNGNFKWNTTFLFSYNKDKIISYDTKYTSQYLTSTGFNIDGPARYGLYILEGNSLFGVYSFKTAGLDPTNGDPQGYLHGEISKDYLNIITSSNTEDIIYHGSSRPRNFGALRNTFSFKGISFSANFTYKFGYYFRRRSTPLNLSDVVSSGYANQEFIDRWQAPGDETHTTVPSVLYEFNYNRNNFYQSSESLVEKGDHIRLQDISLSYDFNKELLRNLPLSSLQIYSYINNIGIVWRANKKGIDPDLSEYNLFGYNSCPNPTTVSFGIRTTLK
ncbi:SusC/RagA family TonB-linked outer membrane protein [Chryseobacterium sp. DT-3]|uniref:SusC/RagA family TonB-linked outer membrane protein n=1 Tax=Chryseobacterium sp. DT-3 TaxID=3396164 RepID=UPI003F1AFBF4